MDDMYLYDAKGQKSAETIASIGVNEELVSFRGIKVGDAVTKLADKYDLKEFQVIVLDDPTAAQTATKENIQQKGDLVLISDDVMSGTSVFFMTFIIEDQKISWIMTGELED